MIKKKKKKYYVQTFFLYLVHIGLFLLQLEMLVVISLSRLGTVIILKIKQKIKRETKKSMKFILKIRSLTKMYLGSSVVSGCILVVLSNLVEAVVLSVALKTALELVVSKVISFGVQNALVVSIEEERIPLV